MPHGAASGAQDVRRNSAFRPRKKQTYRRDTAAQPGPRGLPLCHEGLPRQGRLRWLRCYLTWHSRQQEVGTPLPHVTAEGCMQQLSVTLASVHVPCKQQSRVQTKVCYVALLPQRKRQQRARPTEHSSHRPPQDPPHTGQVLLLQVQSLHSLPS